MSKEITSAISRLKTKLLKVDPNLLEISDYNRNYLNKYIQDFDFYMTAYSQLLQKALRKLEKPIAESTFIDYGGGCGILSCLASELGFRSVIYSDIYPVSVKDSRVITKALGCDVNFFIEGDIEEFVNKISINKIQPDLICSFDVLEHIYDLEKWFQLIGSVKGNFSLVFMTSANPYNPIISRRIKAMHRRAEFDDLYEDAGWKDSDLATSFLKERKLIIGNKFPELASLDVEMLAKRTRGLRVEEILKIVQIYLDQGEIEYEMKHPTNTCDPYTGNWKEHLIDVVKLKQIIRSNHFHVEHSNSLYGYSNNRILNIPKFILNVLIRILGKGSLILSPTYTIEVQTQNS
ncbi:class I SAM-dependent methyltransferase [Sunxiuqinia sp. A32]|uniref:class I SAM-dependent methyltransferase n=1 Tax=Sunxiuqinia sp. A32 TaxID=3461496 RepID=UPI0040465CB2